MRMGAASEDTEQHLCTQKRRAKVEIAQRAKSLRHFDFSHMLQSGDGDSSGIFMMISRPIIFGSVVRKLSKLWLNSKSLSNQNAAHQFLFC